MEKLLRYASSISILSGTIIGAGMFSLPFVFKETGFFWGLANLLFFGFIFYIMHSMYADIILRTEKLPGFSIYAKKYLGSWSMIPAALSTVFGILLTSTIYLVLAVSFAELILPGIKEWFVVFPFWFLGSLAIFLRIERLAALELVIVSLMAIALAILLVFGLVVGSYNEYSHNFIPGSLAILFLPFGPALFSLSGRSAIPPLLEDAKKNNIPNAGMAKIIFYGTTIPIIFYVFFVLGIWGLSDVVSENSISGISVGGGILISALGLLGIVSLFKTYIPLNLSVKKILETDFKINHFAASAIVVLFPMFFYLMHFGFLQLVKIVGGVFLAAESIIISLIWIKLNKIKKPRILIKRVGSKTAYFVIAIFLLGLLSEFMYS